MDIFVEFDSLLGQIKSEMSKLKLKTLEGFLKLKYTTHFKCALQESYPATVRSNVDSTSVAA